MALPINVGELIENRVVESTRIEYKSDWDPEPIVHSITAFANDIDNSGGGYIVVGIAEQNGMPKIPISGLNKGSIDRIQKELLNKCNLIEPRYLPVVEPSTSLTSYIFNPQIYRPQIIGYGKQLKSSVNTGFSGCFLLHFLRSCGTLTEGYITL